MTLDAIGVPALGMFVSWSVWVSVSLFKHTQEIALVRQEITVLKEVREILAGIRLKL